MNETASPRSCGAGAGQTLSLPVLAPDPKRTIRKSKMGPKRALALIAVHVVIIAHVAWWYFSGPEGARKATLSPVEPSESMYTLEKGLVNAGFVFFTLSILSTLILGRFFCGWACHVVALQDLCAWMMKKLGVRPRPFRSRLLVYAPLVLALYMFVWPTFKREALIPLVGEKQWASVAPYFGDPAPRPVFKAEFMKEDFWETFPPWYVAIPFFLVCGFGCVYFLGSKGFCTYGCPYGGFFGPAELVAPGKIVVDHDKCEQCGHCTAVCTSNVRVHEEIRDFGKVVDPGCFKCMDCVSVCPNDALSFSFAAPTVFTRPRDEAAVQRLRERKKTKKLFDLSLWQEFVAAALFVVMVLGFRNMLGQVPLLMAMGCAAIAVFCAWKLWRLVTEKNLTHLNIQLKLGGRLKPAGAIFAVVALVVVALGSWGFFVRYNLWRGTILDGRISTSADVVLARDYAPSPADKEAAESALAHFRRAGAWSEGGYGWKHDGEQNLRMAWLSAVAGKLEEAERLTDRVIAGGKPTDETVASLLTIKMLRGATREDVAASYRAVLDRHPHLHRTRLGLAQMELNMNNARAAVEHAERLAASDTTDGMVLSGASEIFLRVAEATARSDAKRAADLSGRAAELMKRALAVHPDDAGLHSGLGVALFLSGDRTGALAEMQEAARLAPENPAILQRLALVLHQLGRQAEAAQVEARVRALQPTQPR